MQQAYQEFDHAKKLFEKSIGTERRSFTDGDRKALYKELYDATEKFNSKFDEMNQVRSVYEKTPYYYFNKFAGKTVKSISRTYIDVPENSISPMDGYFRMYKDKYDK